MAGGGPEFSAGNRRSMNAEVNLVPFIDLLSVCICFLLMTAVWVQIGALDVKQSFGTSTSVPENTYALEVRFANDHEARITVKQKGKAERPLVVTGADAHAMREAFSQQLGEMVAKRGIPGSAILNAHESVTHGDMIAVMDVLRKHKVQALGITAGG